MTTARTLKEGLALLLCAVIALNGCTRTNNVKADPDWIPQDVEVGDEVNITTLDGEEYNLWVREVGEDSLTGSEGQHGKGEHHTIAYADIQFLNARELNSPATAGIVLGVLGVMAAIVALSSMTLFAL
jgi:hypothetical protein